MRLEFLPGQHRGHAELGRERAEDEIAAQEVHGALDGQGAGRSGLHEHRGVRHDIVRAEDIQLGEIISEPAGKLFLQRQARGRDQREAGKVLRMDDVLRGQRMVAAQQQSPALALWQATVIEFCNIHRFEQQAEVQQSLVQPLDDILGAVRVKFEPHLRIARSEGLHDRREELRCRKTAAANRDRPADLALMLEIGQRLVNQGQDFLGMMLQQDAAVRECQPPAAQKKLRAELLLELVDLPGKRRLRDVQHLGRPGDILFLRDRQEILQDADLHDALLPPEKRNPFFS